MNFDDLIHEKSILEVRFIEGYLYWDRCGSIWKYLCTEFHDLSMRSVTPEEATFVIDKEMFTLSFNQSRIIIDQSELQNLNVFKKIAKSVIPFITNKLEINTYTRVGHRNYFVVQTKDATEAEDLFKSYGLLNITNEKIEIFGGSLAEPGVKFVTLKEDVGYIFNIHTFSRSLDIKVPTKRINIDTSKIIKFGVMFDIDYFTRKPVDVSIFDPLEFIESFHKTMRKNFLKLLK